VSSPGTAGEKYVISLIDKSVAHPVKRFTPRRSDPFALRCASRHAGEDPSFDGRRRMDDVLFAQGVSRDNRNCWHALDRGVRLCVAVPVCPGLGGRHRSGRGACRLGVGRSVGKPLSTGSAATCGLSRAVKPSPVDEILRARHKARLVLAFCALAPQSRSLSLIAPRGLFGKKYVVSTMTRPGSRCYN
jgi:hypothetical protein